MPATSRGFELRDAFSTIPNRLTAARLALIAVLWVLAWLRLPNYVAVGILAALLSDVLDGVLARRLDQVSEFGSRFDSLADNILLPSVLVWLWMLRGEIFSEHPWLLGTAILLHVAAIVLGLLKFRRFANLHLYSSRAASIPMYVFVLHALVADRYSAALLYAAAGLFALASAERLLILLSSEKVDEHMGSVLLVWRRRQAERHARRGARNEEEGASLRSSGLGKRVLAALALIAVVMAAYMLWARPYQLRWGATNEELRRSMPGDELDPSPGFLATRAITINGTPEAIWPWLLQMGFTRGGFYGYDVIENAGSPGGLQSATRILPEFQDFKVGDKVPISPVATLIFHAIEPNSYLVWSGEAADGGFTWALYPINATQTRLVSRIRWSHHWTQPGLLALDLFTEFTDHLAVRKVLQGVKGRVEAYIQPASDANIELLIYVGMAMVFAWGTLSVLRLPLSWGSWLTGLSAGLAWLVSWYAPVSIWTGAALGFLVLWAIRVEFRDAARTRAARTDEAGHASQPRSGGSRPRARHR